MGKRWTEFEKIFLKENYGKIPTQEISCKISRSVSSIKQRASELALTKDQIHFSDDEFLEAIKLSTCHKQAKTKLGYSSNCSSFENTRYENTLKRLNPDISHFTLQSRSLSRFRSHYHFLESKFNRDKSGAIERNLEFKLNLDEYIRLSLSKCFYCGCQGNSSFRKPKSGLLKRSSKHELFVCGIDRMNNKMGYNIDNCVSCCKDCNFMKSDKDINYWFAKIKSIYEHIGMSDVEIEKYRKVLNI
jgi:hypothetical protein